MHDFWIGQIHLASLYWIKALRIEWKAIHMNPSLFRTLWAIIGLGLTLVGIAFEVLGSLLDGGSDEADTGTFDYGLNSSGEIEAGIASGDGTKVGVESGDVLL